MENCLTRTALTVCDERVVCRCLGITEADVLEALTTQEIRSLRDLRQQTGAGDGCTACHRLLKQYLERASYSSASPICSVR